jgi:hypothetical protein
MAAAQAAPIAVIPKNRSKEFGQRPEKADDRDSKARKMSAVSVTYFRGYAAGEKWVHAVTLEALAQRIRTTTAPAKSQLPWLKLARFGNAKTAAGSLRHDANVIACTGVEADYDGERISLDEAVETAEKAALRCIIYTSPSHSEARPRWRLLCPAEREFQPKERGWLLGRVHGLYGRIFARESWTLSQAYYYGSVANNPAHRVELIDGCCIDQLDELDEIALGPPGVASGEIGEAGSDGRVDAELIRRIVTGDGYHPEMCALAARYVGRGLRAAPVADILRGIMLAWPEADRDARWHERFKSINSIVNSAAAKFAKRAEGRRSIARITHRLAHLARPAEEIKTAVLVEAARFDIDPGAALTITAGILREKVEEGRHHA